MARLVVGNGWTCACDREKCSTECEYYLDFMSVKTNGDKIREMSDEELAEWFCTMCNWGDFCPYRDECDPGEEHSGVIKWLKKEAE